MLCHQYADNIQLYLSFQPSTVDDIPFLECCLEVILKWMGGQQSEIESGQDGGALSGKLLLPADWDFSLVLWGTLSAKVHSLGILLNQALYMDIQIAPVV